MSLCPSLNNQIAQSSPHHHHHAHHATIAHCPPKYHRNQKPKLRKKKTTRSLPHPTHLTPKDKNQSMPHCKTHTKPIICRDLEQPITAKHTANIFAKPITAKPIATNLNIQITNSKFYPYRFHSQSPSLISLHLWLGASPPPL